MRVLMSSYACEPNRGSEPGVGWNWALQVARFHEVWVITRANNREGIEAELLETPQPNLRFIYHDLPKWASGWKRKGRGIRLYNYLWEMSVLLPAMRAQRQYEFEVIHHVTLNSIETPGLLWLLPPSFVWGPVGGAQVSPPGFREYFGDAWMGEVFRAFRKSLLRANPIVRGAVGRAQLVMAANRDTLRSVEALGGRNTILELETAVHLSEINGGPEAKDETESLRILWSGGLIARKAPLLALDAVDAAVSLGAECEISIVGDGVLREMVRQRAAAPSLRHRVRLLGQVTYTEMQNLYETADVFLFSSLNDTSGNVVLEAMSYGLPVITLDHHGAAEMVTCETGIKVDVREPKQAVQDLANAILRLQSDPQLVRSLGQAGRDRVEEMYTWSRKGDLVNTLYQDVRGGDQ